MSYQPKAEVRAPRVYIMNNGGHDYSGAKKYGDLVFITDELIDREDTAQMYHVVDIAMRDSTADDYILISSLSSMCSIASGYFSALHGELHLLIHSRGEYVSRDIIMDPP